MKIKKLLENLIVAQQETNINLSNIDCSLKEQIKSMNKNIVDKTISQGISISNLAKLETNIYTKDETIKIIDNEYDYLKRYNEYKQNNEILLTFIETYCAFKDKYAILDIFEEINKKYIINKKSLKKE